MCVLLCVSSLCLQELSSRSLLADAAPCGRRTPKVCARNTQLDGEEHVLILPKHAADRQEGVDAALEVATQRWHEQANATRKQCWQQWQQSAWQQWEQQTRSSAICQEQHRRVCCTGRWLGRQGQCLKQRRS